TTRCASEPLSDAIPGGAIPGGAIPGELEVALPVELGGRTLRRGARVRLALAPRRNDASAVVPDGRTARIERIYRGLDERVYLGVSIESDPGADLMRESGRFLYFFPHEVCVLDA